MSRTLGFGFATLVGLMRLAASLPLQAQQAATSLRQVAVTDSLRMPEAVRYDPELDRYYVTEMNQSPIAKDNNGTIRIASPDGKLDPEPLAAGGVKGVTLNAPKGMVLLGDTLWVADIDAVRGFNRRTGAPVATIDFAPLGALFLNDIAAAPDGTLYVTDSGFKVDTSGFGHPGPDRIYQIKGRTPSVALEGPELAAPNGITWDGKNRRFIVVPFAGDTIRTWTPGSKPVALATGPGQLDGVEVLGDGRVIVTSWTDSTVNVVRGNKVAPLVKGVAGPADIGIDTKRHRVAVPQLTEGRVVYYELPTP